MDLTDKERGVLQKITGDENTMSLLGKIASAMLFNWAQHPVDEQTAFLTAKATIGRQERKKALTSYLETLEKLAHGKE
jgi:hypothetical protein